MRLHRLALVPAALLVALVPAAGAPAAAGTQFQQLKVVKLPRAKVTLGFLTTPAGCTAVGFVDVPAFSTQPNAVKHASVKRATPEFLSFDGIITDTINGNANQIPVAGSPAPGFADADYVKYVQRPLKKGHHALEFFAASSLGSCTASIYHQHRYRLTLKVTLRFVVTPKR